MKPKTTEGQTLYKNSESSSTIPQICSSGRGISDNIPHFRLFAPAHSIKAVKRVWIKKSRVPSPQCISSQARHGSKTTLLISLDLPKIFSLRHMPAQWWAEHATLSIQHALPSTARLPLHAAVNEPPAEIGKQNRKCAKSRCACECSLGTLKNWSRQNRSRQKYAPSGRLPDPNLPRVPGPGPFAPTASIPRTCMQTLQPRHALFLHHNPSCFR